MTTTKYTNMKTNIEELEEIYMERARYLLCADDLLEEVLSEQIEVPNQGKFDQVHLENMLIANDDNINVDTDIPITIGSEFGNI